MELMRTPTCDKLNAQIDEYNAIAMFIEWLQENRMCVAVWRSNEEVGENTWLLDHPYPWSSPTQNLIYKYLDIDPVELEKERRQILRNLQVLDETQEERG